MKKREGVPTKKSAGHTPGPWTYDALQRGGGYKALKTRWTILAPGVDDEVGTVRRGGDIGEANARLIAAAPDMLEALRLCELHLRSNHDGGLADTVRAAIAKAQGE